MVAGGWAGAVALVLAISLFIMSVLLAAIVAKFFMPFLVACAKSPRKEVVRSRQARGVIRVA